MAIGPERIVEQSLDDVRVGCRKGRNANRHGDAGV
jgi:hypothetical protein